MQVSAWQEECGSTGRPGGALHLLGTDLRHLDGPPLQPRVLSVGRLPGTGPLPVAPDVRGERRARRRVGLRSRGGAALPRAEQVRRPLVPAPALPSRARATPCSDPRSRTELLNALAWRAFTLRERNGAVVGSWLFDLVCRMSQFAASRGNLVRLLEEWTLPSTELRDVACPRPTTSGSSTRSNGWASAHPARVGVHGGARPGRAAGARPSIRCAGWSAHVGSGPTERGVTARGVASPTTSPRSGGNRAGRVEDESGRGPMLVAAWRERALT